MDDAVRDGNQRGGGRSRVTVAASPERQQRTAMADPSSLTSVHGRRPRSHGGVIGAGGGLGEVTSPSPPPPHRHRRRRRREEKLLSLSDSSSPFGSSRLVRRDSGWGGAGVGAAPAERRHRRRGSADREKARRQRGGGVGKTWGRESGETWGQRLASRLWQAKFVQCAEEFGQPDGLAIRLASLSEGDFTSKSPKFNLERGNKEVVGDALRGGCPGIRSRNI
uniref:Uncharacterized protein n=1 Tax=Oryza meridionalis TaxID=40149 RepID=A0A0E0DNE8_9ORYZ